jgi:hypothetical protein
LARDLWLRHWPECGRGPSDLTRASKKATLAEHDLELLLQRLAPEKRVERLAAGDQVFFSVRSAIRLSKKMFNACVRLLEWTVAEETVATLFEEELVELLRERAMLV